MPGTQHVAIVFAFSLFASGLFNFRILNFQSPRPGRKYTTVERLKPERLQRVKQDRERLQRARKVVTLQTGFKDFRAIMHAHAEDSAHTGGTRPELLNAARETGVKIILLTDHVRPPKDFISDSWRGIHEGVLFIPGAESEGFLVYPQQSILKAYADKAWKTREEYISLVKPDGGIIFLSHVEEKDDWDTANLDGLEVYNNHTDFEDEPEFIKWLRGAFTDADQLRQVESILKDYPMEVFGASQDYLPQIIAKWDRDLRSRRLTGIAANDCHHNQVYTIRAVDAQTIELNIIGDPPRKLSVQQAPGIAPMLKNRQAGEIISVLDFDPYPRSLQYVSTHILTKDLTESAVRQGLRQSRAYVSHDWLCDPTGFAYIAEKKGKRIGLMGDEIPLTPGLQLRLAAPVAGTIKLYRNGSLVKEANAEGLVFDVTEAGVYRPELWLEIDGELRPWIYANPIRVK